MKKIIPLIACSLLAGYSFAEKRDVQTSRKRPLDIEACESWNRIDNARLSPTGRYVTYKITPISEEYGSKNPSATMLFDRQGKRLKLGNPENINYFGEDKYLYYTENDTMGTAHTYIVDLPSGRKHSWQHIESLEPIHGTMFSASRLYVKEDSIKHIKSHTDLIIRNLQTDDSTRIEHTLYHEFYNHDKNIIFMQEKDGRRILKYGAIMGPYKTFIEKDKEDLPSSFAFDSKKLIGQYDIKDSIFCKFDLATQRIDTTFVTQEIPLPNGKRIVRVSMMKNPNYVLLELADGHQPMPNRRKETRKKDKSFELELWTWNEEQVPTLQSEHPYQRSAYPKYIYDRSTKKLTYVAPSEGELSLPYRDMSELNYLLYTDGSAYKQEKEWKEKLPYVLYAVNIHNGEKRMVGKEYYDMPKWSPDGRWAMIYNAKAKRWDKFDAATGELENASAKIPYPVYDLSYDKPAPAPSYGIGGWSEDGKFVYVLDEYDWWKVDLHDVTQTSCLTQGKGRKQGISYRILYSNIDKDVFSNNDKVFVKAYHQKDMSQSICTIDMRGQIRELVHGDYAYNVNSFSDNRKYCLWTRQNTQTFPDLWVSDTNFKNAKKVTEANPQQKNYLWGSVKIVEWTNYENKTNRGLLYLPEGYDAKKKYPMIVQFYETHTEEKNNYCMPMLSSAMANIMYAVSNGYIVFMPDIHFTIGTPGQSTYDAVVSGTNWLIDQGIAHKGMIGLQGHSWSGFQTTYLVTKTDLFDCAQIGAPITDMVTGYLGIRNGSGLPRYFMYEDTQSRMGQTLWEAKDKYRAMSPIINADQIHTPLLIFHNDHDEAVAYEQGRALYLAMRRLQRPAWMVNYKGEGHFVMNRDAEKDWTIRMMQFFDHYLKKTPEPRWMAEGIQLKDRGYDQKYDLVK